MAKATDCSTLLQPERCLLAYRSTCNPSFIDIPVSFFTYVPFVLADSEKQWLHVVSGFLCIIEIVCIFIVATLITEVLLNFQK